jgi:hypothetical protein
LLAKIPSHLVNKACLCPHCAIGTSASLASEKSVDSPT